MAEERATRLKRRATAEYLAADGANHPAARAAHLTLARLYEHELALLREVAPAKPAAAGTAHFAVPIAQRSARVRAVV